MSAATVNSRQLLDQIRRMKPDEYDWFIEQALMLRPKGPKSALSPKETELVQRINRGLPVEINKRYVRLTAKRGRGQLTSDERKELLRITDEVELLDAARAEALAELAKRKGIPIRALMQEMGIKAPPIHG